MRWPRAVALILLLAAAAAAVLLCSLRGRGPAPASFPPSLRTASLKYATTSGDGPRATEPPAPAPEAMLFTTEGVAGTVAHAIEDVVRPGNVQVAVHPRGQGRWMCILADGPDRYYELDAGLRPDDFPFLQQAGFRPPPGPVARTTTSIYRSLAKKALGYDTARGDRILILLCPRTQWPQLALHWPSPAAPR